MKQSLSLSEAFMLYEKARAYMPTSEFPANTVEISSLVDIADEFDVAVLDSFGVLNVGDQTIPGAAETIAKLRAQDKHIIVLTNGATLDQPGAVAKVCGFGFDIQSEDVISSRSALHAGLGSYATDLLWGIMAPEHANCETFGINYVLLGDDPESYAKADGYIMLSTYDWPEHRQEMMRNALLKKIRPVLVGNPDLIAPRVGFMSVEPGYYAWALHEACGVEPVNYGKPHVHVFDQVKTRIAQALGTIDLSRVLMVGDSLHTDIIGGAAAGFTTVLTTQDGFFSKVDPKEYFEKSGIRPHYMLPRI